MANITIAMPGDLETPNSGYAYDRRVLALLPSYGLDVTPLTLPGAFPRPSAQDLEATRVALTGVPAGERLLIDGLAYCVLPAATIRGLNRRVFALIHYPVSLAGGFAGAGAAAAEAREHEALALAAHVIVTSTATADILRTRFQVAPERMTIARPGTEPAQRATGTGTPLQILAVGAVTRARDYANLIDALIPLVELDWRLAIVGALDRDADAVCALKDKIEAARLGERVRLTGQIVPGTLDRYYDGADLFVSPAGFEAYGMPLAEAMARGLPIVCAVGGVAGETVPDGAAVRFEPGNSAALSAALAKLLGDRKQRRKLADAAWEAGRLLPTWNETARRIAAAVLDLHA